MNRGERLYRTALIRHRNKANHEHRLFLMGWTDREGCLRPPVRGKGRMLGQGREAGDEEYIARKRHRALRDEGRGGLKRKNRCRWECEYCAANDLHSTRQREAAMAADKKEWETGMADWMDITDEQAEKLAADAAEIVAPLFFMQEWEWSKHPYSQADEKRKIREAILDQIKTANTQRGNFLPIIRRGRIMVEILPDVNAAHVWVRVGDLSRETSE